jgi:hypothetical protein
MALIERRTLGKTKGFALTFHPSTASTKFRRTSFKALSTLIFAD